MILFFILKVHFAMTIQKITLFLCIKKLWKQSNVKTIRPKKLWIVQKVLNVEHFNFEELKLIVKLISFRLIFFKLIFLRFVITLFSVALSLFTAKCKKKRNGHYPVSSDASLQCNLLLGRGGFAIPLYTLLKRRNTLSHNDDF